MKTLGFYLGKIRTYIKTTKTVFLLSPIRKRRVHGYFLYTETDKKSISVIVIDPRKQFIPTLIHEILHALYENKTEEEILDIEEYIMENINSKQILKLLCCFCTHAKIYSGDAEELM
jgi:hypothetical protein